MRVELDQSPVNEAKMNVLRFTFCPQEIQLIPSGVNLRRESISGQGLIFPQKQNKLKPKRKKKSIVIHEN